MGGVTGAPRIWGWWEDGAALDGRDSGSLWGSLSGGHGKEACRGGGGLRVRAQLRSAAYQVHSWQGPSCREVGRGRFLGVSTPRRGVVSSKCRGRGLSGLQGSVKLGCLLPPSDVQRGPQVASEVWGCSSANLLLVKGGLGPPPPSCTSISAVST